MSSGGKSKKKRPQLCIVLDTNQLHTGSASDLVRQTLAKLIVDSRKHTDVELKWYLPEIVRHERQFQMTEAADKLIPSLEKIERLIDHNLALSREKLHAHVNDAVEREVSKLGLQLLPTDPKLVDWTRVMHDSLYRVPPFSKGEREKGFRDAMILEAAAQLVKQLPKTPAICRIAIVTDDNLLTDALQERFQSAKNVRLLASEEALQGLINTMVGDVEEDFVSSIQERAEVVFFDSESKDGIFYKEDIRDRIENTYSDALRSLPSGATSREAGNWYISRPQFVSKQSHKITWRTTIRATAKAYKLDLSEHLMPDFSQLVAGSTSSRPAPTWLGTGWSRPAPQAFQPIGVQTGVQTGAFTGSTLGHLANTTPTHTLLAEVETAFHVTWTVTVTAANNLTRAKVVSIDLVETNWNPAT